MLPSYEHRLKRATPYEGFSFSEAERSVNPSEMADFIKYLQKYADIQPRTYWYETPFYRIFRNARLLTTAPYFWSKGVGHLENKMKIA